MFKKLFSLSVFSFLLLSAVAFAEASETLKIKGMMCSSCSNKVEAAFKESGRIETIKVDPKAGTALVTWKEGQKLSSDEIKNLVDKVGFELQTDS